MNEKVAVRQYWQHQLKTSFKDIDSLLSYLQLENHPDFSQLQAMQQASKQFKLLVPLHFAKLMEKGNPADPLLLQVLPQAEELQVVEGFIKDPLAEISYAYNQQNLINKYSTRLLFLPKSSCAVNCRYCFRRHFPYQEIASNKSHWDESFTIIRQNTELEEIILSGGDPLLCNDKEIEYIVSCLEKIPHIKTLRIHSRTPVVIPARVTEQLCKIFAQTQLKLVMVLHINHPNEISFELQQACKKLQQNNVVLLNQNVLLKNINDEAKILKKLYSQLFLIGVIPYYLFLLDKVAGAAHFQVDKSTAIKIYRQLQQISSGYLVPKLAVEEQMKKSKTLVL